jgi:hypothetical protein
VDRRQIDQNDAIGEAISQATADFQRQAGLAYPSRSHETQETNLIANQPLFDRIEFDRPS